MAKLKIDIRESIELNNNKYDNFNSFVIQEIDEISKRIATIPLTEQSLVSISGSLGAGSFITSDVRYMRFTNMGNPTDPQANVRLTFKNTNDNEFQVKIPTGGSFLYNGISGSGVSNTLACSGSALSSSLGDGSNPDDTLGSLSTITAISSGSACDLEYIVASN
tara:strand:+ start:196 stop:687 length:492 start_codon:yes stop_codon:yes gene_type:complete